MYDIFIYDIYDSNLYVLLTSVCVFESYLGRDMFPDMTTRTD
jgi:hypothetical protein